jgi:hypothetical protein
MVHAALLLLMLEAANADLVFTISLKRSTPNLQLSTSRPITPSLPQKQTSIDAIGMSAKCQERTLARQEKIDAPFRQRTSLM